MTPASRGLPAVEAELVRARETLRAARVLFDAGLFADTVGRAYYAMFHAATALLASVGRTARTHDGIRSQLAEHFVRPGLLDPTVARSLAHGASDRQDADYDSQAVFSAEVASARIVEAETVLSVAERLLASNAP